MLKILWTVTGICAAALGWIVLGPKRVRPIGDLAHRLEDAWTDHHTVA